MKAGDADIVDGFGAITERARGNKRFLSDRDVAGAHRNHQYSSLSANDAVALDKNRSRERMEPGRGGQPPYGRVDALVGAGYQDVVPAVAPGEHGANDAGDLIGRFPASEDDFGKAPAERAMVVHFREAEVFEGQIAEALDGRGLSEAAGADVAKQLVQCLFVHRGPILSSRMVRIVRLRRIGCKKTTNRRRRTAEFFAPGVRAG